MNAATLPALALGTVQFGLAYGIAGRDAPVDEHAVRSILELASAAGVTRLDTAAAYGDIEQRLARLIGDLSFGVVSKIPAIAPGLAGAERLAFVEAAIRQSHARLGGLLCGLLFHDAALFAGGENDGLWDHSAGLCARLGIPLGVSGYDPGAMAGLAARLPLAMVQLPANALDQRITAAAPGLARCETSLRSIFLQGLLLLEPDQAVRRLPACAPAILAWQAWCAQACLPPLEAALAIARGLPAAYCVVGVDDPAQFEAIARAWSSVQPCHAAALAQADPALIDPRQWPRSRAA